MSWRITGTERLAGFDPRDPWDGRRADVAWDDDDGLVIAPGSEWVIERLRELDGDRTSIFGGGGPTFDVDLGDPASAFWATRSLLYSGPSLRMVNAPDRIWIDTTPAGAPN